MRVLLIVYDNESYVHHPPVALMYIASALRQAGHEVSVYSQDLYHWPEEHLTDYLTRNPFDVVGLSLVAGYYPYHKMLKISEAINRVPKRPFYILGGHGPSPEPEFYLKKSGADCVVVGEGERTIVDLMAILYQKPLCNVNGIAFWGSGGVFSQTPRQSLIQDLDSIPFPAYDLFPMDYYALFRVGNITKPTERVGIMIAGRGCPFHCNFCYRMDAGYRVHSPEYIVDHIRKLMADYHLDFFQFQDELLMTSEQRTMEVSEAILKADLGIRWGCNGRLNFATPEVLALMKRAGCCFINYGIESVDDDALRLMGKNLTLRQITEGIEATLEVGIHPGFNIIWGNIGETKETLRKGVDFLLKYDDQGQVRTIRPVTPYPGSPLYYYAIKTGMLKDCEDFYENKLVNSDLASVQFTGLPDQEFNQALYRANTTLLRNYHRKQQQRAEDACHRLYIERETAGFRGFRQT